MNLFAELADDLIEDVVGPSMASEVAIDSHSSSSVRFYATNDAVQDFCRFGHITREGAYYVLWVDMRYNLEEVIEYIENYG